MCNVTWKPYHVRNAPTPLKFHVYDGLMVSETSLPPPDKMKSRSRVFRLQVTGTWLQRHDIDRRRSCSPLSLSSFFWGCWGLPKLSRRAVFWMSRPSEVAGLPSSLLNVDPESSSVLLDSSILANVQGPTDGTLPARTACHTPPAKWGFA